LPRYLHGGRINLVAKNHRGGENRGWRIFGEYKLFRSSAAAWTTTGFREYLHGYINEGEAAGFYARFLASVVQPHSELWAHIVGLGELAIGISLVLGLWVRAASIGGIVHMVNLTLATWWAAGRNVDTWRWFGVELDHIPMLLLFSIFFVASAGTAWGLDALLNRKRLSKQKFDQYDG